MHDSTSNASTSSVHELTTQELIPMIQCSNAFMSTPDLPCPLPEYSRDEIDSPPLYASKDPRRPKEKLSKRFRHKLCKMSKETLHVLGKIAHCLLMDLAFPFLLPVIIALAMRGVPMHTTDDVEAALKNLISGTSSAGDSSSQAVSVI